MEEIKIRLQSMNRALGRLDEMLEKIKKPELSIVYDELRDSAIQRFEFNHDPFWKLLKVYLFERYNCSLEAPSLKKVFRATLQNQIISEDEFTLLLAMIEDRNLTPHTYHEEIAVAVYNNIYGYYSLMVAVVKRLEI